MTYRKLMYAGAASATIGLLAGGLIAQVGQQQRQQQPRPGQVSPINGEDFLGQLEGNWNVEVTIYQMDALEGRHTTRPGERRTGEREGTGQQQIRQIEQQLQQSFTRAGISQQEAQRHAQQLAQRIQRERPERQQLQQMIQQELTRAGVSQQQAQQEAQRVAGQIQPMIQRDGAGIRPEDDPTAPPVRPGTEDDRTRTTPGQPTRPGAAPGQQDREMREAQVRGEGNATRSWALNDTILREELTFTVEKGNNNPEHQQRRPGQEREMRIDLRNGDEYEGLGLFAFEPANGELSMVWADNTKSMLHYGIGQYDSARQAMVFYTIDPHRVTLPSPTGRPGVGPTQRPGAGGPQDRTGAGQQDRPGTRDQVGQERMRLDQEGNRIALRVISDDEHVVTVYRSNPQGRAIQVMELRYTRNN